MPPSISFDAWVFRRRSRLLIEMTWRLGISRLAEQNQDQHDNEYEAEPAAIVVAGPIESAAAEPAKAPDQRDYQNDEQDAVAGIRSMLNRRLL